MEKTKIQKYKGYEITYDPLVERWKMCGFWVIDKDKNECYVRVRMTRHGFIFEKLGVSPTAPLAKNEEIIKEIGIRKIKIGLERNELFFRSENEIKNNLYDKEYKICMFEVDDIKSLDEYLKKLDEQLKIYERKN